MTSTPAWEFSQRLLDILCTAETSGVIVIEAYFDESGSHHGSSILVVAGYLFDREQAVRFCEEWRTVLNSYGLPYFRMSECAPCAGVFSGKPCDEIERRMIGIIRRRQRLGIAVSLSQKDYDDLTVPKFRVAHGDAYTFATQVCLDAVHDWIEHAHYEGEIAYFFESGHESEKVARRFMDMVYRDQGLRNTYRISSVTFAGKRSVLPLQAADLLAWQWHKDFIRNDSIPRRARRLDLAALLEPPAPHHVKHWQRDKLRGFLLGVVQSDASDHGIDLPSDASILHSQPFVHIDNCAMMDS